MMTVNARAIGEQREMRFAALLKERGVEYIHHPKTFILKLTGTYKGRRWYTPDFFVPSEGIYYEVISTRQCLRDNQGEKLKRIELTEKIFGIIIKIVKPDGSPYRRELHQGQYERRRLARKPAGS